MMSVKEIREGLACGRQGCDCGRSIGNVHCPAHEDRNPSLAVANGIDGTVLVYCHAGCPQGEVIDALRGRELWPTPRPSAPGPRKTSSERYEVRNTDGELIAVHVRKDAGAGRKSFYWERDGAAGLKGLSQSDLPLYGSERLRALPSGSRLVVTEGEKDADALLGREIAAVGTVTGASGTPGDDVLAPLVRFAVVVWPDADEDGKGLKHMRRVGDRLLELGCKDVRMADWAEAPPKGGAADFDGDDSELLTLLEAASHVGCSESADGASLLNEVRHFVRRFVVLTDLQSDAVTLWIAHTHAMDAADCTPYLNIKSAEKESGKTRLLEVLDCLVAKPWFTSRVSAAVLMRKVDALCPTLLLDESDAAFKGEKEYSEALRGMLNAGYKRGGKHSVCEAGGGGWTWRDFIVFCPKAIAGIGELPDTVEGRSIPIELKRRAPTEFVEKFRSRTTPAEATPLRGELVDWAAAIVDELKEAEAESPEALRDRASDVWEPLFAIADLAGSDWPERARAAALALSGAPTREDGSTGVRLLRDIQTVIPEGDVERVFSADLVAALIGIEDAPWAEWRGKGLTKPALAALLKPYDIRPRELRIDDTTKRGYEGADFADAFLRYLPHQTETTETTETNREPEYTDKGTSVSDVSVVSPAEDLTAGDGHLVRQAVIEFGLDIVGRRDKVGVDADTFRCRSCGSDDVRYSETGWLHCPPCEAQQGRAV